MDADALISVIAVFYHVENYMRQCITSIMNQTYSNLEIILVVDDLDDPSSETSGRICEEFAQQDDRITVVHKEHRGLISARKAGLKIASGKYVGFVDGDDWIEPQFYEHLYEMMKTYDVSFVEAGIIDSSESGDKKRKSHFAEGYYKDVDYEQSIIPNVLNFPDDFYKQGMTSYLWNKLFDVNLLKQCYEQVDYSGSSVMEDYVVTLPYALNVASVYISHECFYHYRVVCNSGKRTVSRITYSEVSHALNLLEKAIEKTKYKVSMKKQWHAFMLYILVWYCPYLFDHSQDHILSPWGGVSTKEKVVLYGAGAVGISIYNYMITVMDENDILWVDADYQHIDKQFGIQAPETITTATYDKIVIAIFRSEAVKEVKKWLIDHGVKQEKICFIEDSYIKNPRLLLDTIDYAATV